MSRSLRKRAAGCDTGHVSSRRAKLSIAATGAHNIDEAEDFLSGDVLLSGAADAERLGRLATAGPLSRCPGLSAGAFSCPVPIGCQFCEEPAIFCGKAGVP